jgi:acyl-CoA thioester hydrolase
MTPHSLLLAFPVILELPVQWGEMDAYGHVNNTVFFRYFESARMEYLKKCGFVESHERHRIGAILHSTAARFRQPLFFPDTVQIGASASDISDDRFTMNYTVVSLTREVIVAEGSGIIVSFDYSAGKKAVLPAQVQAGIASIERGVRLPDRAAPTS